MQKITALFLVLFLTACTTTTQSFDQQIGSLNIEQEDYGRMIVVRATETGDILSNAI